MKIAIFIKASLLDSAINITLFPYTCGAAPKRSSGVDVHIKIRSRSLGSTSAISRAFLAASTARLFKLSFPERVIVNRNLLHREIRMAIYKREGVSFHLLLTEKIQDRQGFCLAMAKKAI